MNMDERNVLYNIKAELCSAVLANQELQQLLKKVELSTNCSNDLIGALYGAQEVTSAHINKAAKTIDSIRDIDSDELDDETKDMIDDVRDDCIEEIREAAERWIE